jgi:hypothetical protein
MANGQDGIYAKDECCCDDPLALSWCRVHEHSADYDGKCRGRCFTHAGWLLVDTESEGK